MSESVLGRIYRESSSRCHREKVDITGLTEEEFLKTFNSDPFFRERVKVELEKISKSTEGVNLKLLLEEGRSEDSDLSEITLKKKNSLDSGREFEKYQRYINLLTCQK